MFKLHKQLGKDSSHPIKLLIISEVIIKRGKRNGIVIGCNRKDDGGDYHRVLTFLLLLLLTSMSIYLL